MTEKTLFKNILLIVGLLILIVAYVAIANEIYPLQWPFDLKNTSALRPDTTIRATQQEIAAHNAITRELLTQHLALENEHSVAREGSRTQMRGFYLIILAGLIAFLFRSAPRVAKPSKNFTIVVLVFIAVAYILEAHEDDLYKRYKSTSYVYSSAISQLTDSLELASVWQRFDYSTIRDEMNEVSAFLKRWPRILEFATRPGADQIVLYFMPLIALIVTLRNTESSRGAQRRAP